MVKEEGKGGAKTGVRRSNRLKERDEKGASKDYAESP